MPPALRILIAWCCLVAGLTALEQVPTGIVAIEPEATGDEDYAIGGAAVAIADGRQLISLGEAVPAGVDMVTVVLPGGQRGIATVLRRGPATDAILLQLDEALPRLQAMPLGDSRIAEIGITAYTLGNPFNALVVDGKPALSRGIVSGRYELPPGPPVRGRGGQILSTWRGPVIETTAAVNDGNQGGALITDDGRLIGLVSMGVSRDRKVGTAVPLALILRDLGLELPQDRTPAPSDLVDATLAQHAAKLAESLVLVYFHRPDGPGNPDGAPRPQPITDQTPAYRRDALQDAWNRYYHQQQIFYTDQAVNAVVLDAAEGLLVTAASNLHGGARRGRLVGEADSAAPIRIQVLGVDALHDLALLKADRPLERPNAPFAWEPGISTGDPLAVVARHRDGGPFTITTGVVSAAERRPPGRPARFAQTDALANYGSLGAPAIDIHGRVVGIMTLMGPIPNQPWFINSGVAMFADAAVIAAALPAMKTGGDLPEPRVGLGVQLDGAELIVLAVAPGLGAAEAGVAKGDRLLAIDGEKLAGFPDLKTRLDGKAAGDLIELTVVRDEQELTLTVELRSLR